MTPNVLTSTVDQSVNFIEPVENGFHESRYVHRPAADYFIAYISSHNGCNKSCRFCHLTATGQTMMVPATGNQIIQQFDHVLSHYLGKREKLNKMHVNFMSRGEPLANPYITDERMWGKISMAMCDRADLHGIETSFRFSTIMPQEIEGVDLSRVFQHGDEHIYYSLYSFDERFRKRWLPKAMNPHAALHKLKRWQDETGQEVRIHFSLISGENDGTEDIDRLISGVQASGLDTAVNIVRFNSPNDKYRESERIEEISEQLNEAFPARVIPRVGKDVYASCGLFYPG